MTYNSGYSKYNAGTLSYSIFGPYIKFQLIVVERSFSHMTNYLAGLTLDEQEQVVENPGAEDPKKRLNKKVVKDAIIKVQEALEGYTYDNFSWTINTIPFDGQTVDIEGKTFKREFADQEKLKLFHKLTSQKKIRDSANKDLLDE